MLDVHAQIRGLVASMANAGAEAVRVERMPDDSVRVQLEYYLRPNCGCGCPCDALPVPGAPANDVHDTEPPPPAAPAPAPVVNLLAKIEQAKQAAPYSDKSIQADQRPRAVPMLAPAHRAPSWGIAS